MSGHKIITPVTYAQQAVLDYIRSFIATKGYSPTAREIQERFGWKSQTAACHHIDALTRKGRVKSEFGKARTLTVIEVNP